MYMYIVYIIIIYSNFFFQCGLSCHRKCLSTLAIRCDTKVQYTCTVHETLLCVIVSGHIKGAACVTNVMYPCGFICIPVVSTLRRMNLIKI